MAQGMEQSPDEELAALRASGDAFDALVGAVIEDERSDLLESAAQLASCGSVTITRPNGTVTATVHHKLLRPWTLEIEGQRSDGAKVRQRSIIRPENVHDENPHALLRLGGVVAWLQQQPPA
jgi:hypothetical protein